MRASVTLGALLLGVALATPAQAQFKLPKVRLPGTHQASTPAGQTDAAPLKPGRVRFDERVVEITPATLARFERGLAAEEQVAEQVKAQDLDKIQKENAARQAAYDKAWDDYQKRQAKFEACSQPIEDRAQKQTDEHGAELQQQFNEADMQKIAGRIQAAQQRGDMKEVQRLADSVGRASRAASAKPTATAVGAQHEVEQKCGKAPVEPQRPTLTPIAGLSEARSAGEKASGMDGSQYAVMRERIGAWVLSHGRSNGYAYTAGELAALEGHRDALAAHEELFRAF